MKSPRSGRPKAGEYPMRGRFSAPTCLGSHCAGARVRVSRLRDSSRSSGNRPPASADGRCFQGGARTHAASCQLQQRDSRRVTALRFLPAVFQQEKNRLPKAFEAFFLRKTLAVCLRDFRAKCDKPLAVAMHFRSKWKIHGDKTDPSAIYALKHEGASPNDQARS